MTPAEAWGIVLVGLILLGGALVAICLLWMILTMIQGLYRALRTDTRGRKATQIWKGDGS